MNRETYYKLITGGAIAITSFCFFHFFYPYNQYFKEQMQLFLYVPGWLNTYWDKPAVPSCLMGDFFTQFYFLVGGGATVIAISLLLSWWLMVKTFCETGIQRYEMVLALFPVSALWLLQLSPYDSLATMISYQLALLVFLLVIKIRNHLFFFIISLLLIPFLYIMAGAGMYVYLVCLLFYTAGRKYKHIPAWRTIAILLGFVPLYFRYYYLHTLQQSFVYPFHDYEFYIPLCLITAILTFNCSGLLTPKYVFPYLPAILVVTNLIYLVTGIHIKADFTREKILSLDTNAYFGQWNTVEKLATRYHLSHPSATYYANLALAQQGKLPERLLEFYQPGSNALYLYVGPQAQLMNILFSGEVFFQTGDMNMAQHSAMLAMTFSPNTRSSRFAKRLAEINIIQGDYKAAEKYLRMLDKTLFHRKWAVHYRRLAEDTSPSSWLLGKRKLLPMCDRLRTANDPVTSLTGLLDSNPANRIALDYLLCYHLLNKDLASFGQTYHTYQELDSSLPPLYSQALLAWHATRGGDFRQNIQYYNIPASMVQEFLDYSRLYNTNEDINVIRAKYGDSYWFYYHFIQFSGL